jgi:ABC-type cobalamin/Fe3+-siderophores transport system ATPase subunit
VNILSGINGAGKSTIINHSAKGLKMIDRGELTPGEVAEGVTIKLYPSDATSIRFDVIRSFDRPLVNSSLLEKLADTRVRTELDWQIYRLQKRYLDYQVNIGNRIIELLTSGDPEGQMKAAEVSVPKVKFQNMIDDLFKDTGKIIDRKSNEIQFVQSGEVLTPYQLSSGEKQMLVIMLTVLVENGEPHALLMDEPEISLHIEWQQQLIGLIRELNPKAQIILSTHSPALIMDGWLDSVTEVNDVTL